MKEKGKPNHRQPSEQLGYRTPMHVTELYIYWNDDGNYVCPRCHITLEREFTSYCDRCGQCLNWSGYRKARRVYIRQNVR